MVRTLARSILFCVLAAPSLSFALKQPLCPAIKCNGAPNVANDGGTGLSYPEIVPIFWGASYWTPATQGPVLASIQSILSGPYLGALNQYNGSGGGVGVGRMTPIAPIYTAALPATITGALANTAIGAMIANGSVPAPGAHLDLLYIVFVPPTVSGGGASGFNFGGYNGTPFNAAWVIGNNSTALSHEIAESVAGNFGVSNCTYSNGQAANQIGDICYCYSEAQNGQNLAAYWSSADNACVVPHAWGALYQYDSGSSWHQIGGNVRQVYAAEQGSGFCWFSPCVIATDTNDNLQAYQQTPFSWSQIGGPGAMFGLGAGGQVLGMTPDGSKVNRYNGSTWTTVYNNPTAVYSGGMDLVTDYTGSPWQYQSGSFTKVGGPGDQFIVAYDWAAAIGFNHNYVAIFPGLPGGWQGNFSRTAAEIFVGGDGALAARDINASRTISALTTTYSGGAYSFNPWVAGIGGAGNDFAIWGGGGPSSTWLVGLTPSRGAVWQDQNPIESASSNWGQIGGAAGRLVGQGAFLYATSGVVY